MLQFLHLYNVYGSSCSSQTYHHPHLPLPYRETLKIIGEKNGFYVLAGSHFSGSVRNRKDSYTPSVGSFNVTFEHPFPNQIPLISNNKNRELY